MSADLCLVDSNVLVYALYSDGPHHAASKSLLEKAGLRDAGFCVTSQVLAEFYSIVTNPKRVSVAQPAENAIRAIRAILDLPGITVLPAPAAVPFSLASAASAAPGNWWANL